MRNLLYFLPPMAIGSPDKVSEIRYFAERCRLHLEFLSDRPTTVWVQELRDFWNPIGAIVESSADFQDAALTAARLAGLAVPDDLAVLGVDNLTSLCEHTQPPLSSIEPDFRRGAQLAIMLLMAAVRDGRHFHGSRHRAFGDLGLVRRESTPMQQREDREVREALG